MRKSGRLTINFYFMELITGMILKTEQEKLVKNMMATLAIEKYICNLDGFNFSFKDFDEHFIKNQDFYDLFYISDKDYKDGYNWKINFLGFESHKDLQKHKDLPYLCSLVVRSTIFDKFKSLEVPNAEEAFNALIQFLK